MNEAAEGRLQYRHRAVGSRLSEWRAMPAIACRAGHCRERRRRDKPADPIIVHPDVAGRTLSQVPRFNDARTRHGGWTSLKSDVAHRCRESKRTSGSGRPYGADDPGAERFHRKRFANAVPGPARCMAARLIAEQAWEYCARRAHRPDLRRRNGIQALVWFGANCPRDGGRAVMAFFGEVPGAFCHGTCWRPRREGLCATVVGRARSSSEATTWRRQNAMAKRTTAGRAAPTKCICSAW